MKKICGFALFLQVCLLASSCQVITRNSDLSNSYDSNNNIVKSNSVKKKNINVPNDPGFEKQWAFELHNSHSIPKGKGVVIAVVDKFPENNLGTDFSIKNIHPNSKNVQSGKRLATNKDIEELPKNNGSLKENIHGFFITAILVQTTNNKIGTASIVPEAQVMILDVSNDNNAENFNAAKFTAKAIRDAVDNGADIINLSMAIKISDQDVKYAFDHAFNKNVLVVVAAGNDKRANTSYLAKQSDGKIVVESVNRQGKKSSFSDDGELAAAGGEHEGCIEVNDENTNPLGIVQTLSILDDDDDDFEDKLISCSGTSMAAPYVAGGAASVIEILKPAGIQSPLIVEEILKFTAREKGDNAGILDARKAVELANQLVDKKRYF
ncbi:MAG: S8 family serine peptidase [Richelia sp. RM2_1_2]|nr:S8 family serine peptidase [Richelia sp. SM1_7_0]NJN11791.1 S8 family serine peptidase [Richelia sp. RM1_1_1]NJO62753.1 S8 family serine peptidase [Richelia sp. RM2_1_2]